MKVKHLESEVQASGIQECRDLLSCFALQNVLCPCTSRIFCVSVTRMLLTLNLGCVYTLVERILLLTNSFSEVLFLFFIVIRVVSIPTRTYCLR